MLSKLRKFYDWNIKIIKWFLQFNFFKYLLAGGTATIISVFIMWFFVDIVGVLAAYMNLIISSVVFFWKYWIYKKTNMFNEKGNFTRYTAVFMFNLVLSTFLLWYFVDYLSYWVVTVDIITVILLFLMRFYIFHKWGMLNSKK